MPLLQLTPKPRWYSCWLVMLRFYCLYDAIEELLRQIEMGNISVKPAIKDKLKQSKNGLSKEVIHDASSSKMAHFA